MKFAALIFTGLFYILFASSNKSWNTMNWNGDSLYWFGALVLLVWIAVGLVDYFRWENKKSEENRW